MNVTKAHEKSYCTRITKTRKPFVDFMNYYFWMIFWTSVSQTVKKGFIYKMNLVRAQMYLRVKAKGPAFLWQTQTQTIELAL